MRLVSLTVENFRSIMAARKIPIAQMTTLIGPNNEGKSNILRALAIGMNTLLGNRSGRPRSLMPRHSLIVGGRRRHNRPNVYNWESDYPLRLQGVQSTKSSLITLEFELTPTEILEFENAIESRLNGTLPIAFAFKKDGLKISVAKQGRSQRLLNAKADLIADFVADRLGLQYIPAVRTAAAAREIVDGLVASELAKVEDDPRYVRRTTTTNP
jgi:putative ATP-dependent endonuclease of OLD family